MAAHPFRPQLLLNRRDVCTLRSDMVLLESTDGADNEACGQPVKQCQRIVTRFNI